MAGTLIAGFVKQIAPVIVNPALAKEAFAGFTYLTTESFDDCKCFCFQ